MQLVAQSSDIAETTSHMTGGDGFDHCAWRQHRLHCAVVETGNDSYRFKQRMELEKLKFRTNYEVSSSSSSGHHA